jgi:NitT/TauT family transport system ATP-binding protein
MLQIENVAHRYHSLTGTVDALSPLSFSVNDGEFISIIGPSGSGKSTLLRIIAGLIQPSQGTVSLNRGAITSPHREIGMIFQQPNLMAWRTVRENVALPLELAGVSREARQQQADQQLVRVGLNGFQDNFPAQLSGGMAQRVSLARALVHNPQVLLLDEPFAALDAMTREAMLMQFLDIWAAERKIAIMVTHSITDAVFVSDRVLVMSQRPGRLRAEFVVPFARPRALEIIHSNEFGQLVQQVRREIETPF